MARTWQFWVWGILGVLGSLGVWGFWGFRGSGVWGFWGFRGLGVLGGFGLGFFRARVTGFRVEGSIGKIWGLYSGIAGECGVILGLHVKVRDIAP